jgi:hypothetical protein
VDLHVTTILFKAILLIVNWICETIMWKI